MVKFTPAGSRRLRPISRDPYRSTQRSFREEMDVASNNSIHLQRLLDRLKQGDDAARNELIGAAYERLRLLARKLLHHDFPRLRHDTDTILDETVLRLFKAPRECQPPSVREFFTFSAALMRHVLVDLARRQKVRRAHEANSVEGHETDGRRPTPFVDSADGPPVCALWAEFHRRVETLPPEEREVVDLHWYQGLAQSETAELLGKTPKAVSRLWLKARVKLVEWMPGVEEIFPNRG